MKLEDLIVEIVGKDSKQIRAAAQIMGRIAGVDSVGSSIADKMRKGGRELKKLGLG